MRAWGRLRGGLVGVERARGLVSRLRCLKGGAGQAACASGRRAKRLWQRGQARGGCDSARAPVPLLLTALSMAEGERASAEGAAKRRIGDAAAFAATAVDACGDAGARPSAVAVAGAAPPPPLAVAGADSGVAPMGEPMLQRAVVREAGVAAGRPPPLTARWPVAACSGAWHVAWLAVGAAAPRTDAI